jgi:hypothetical protein
LVGVYQVCKTVTDYAASGLVLLQSNISSQSHVKGYCRKCVILNVILPTYFHFTIIGHYDLWDVSHGLLI